MEAGGITASPTFMFPNSSVTMCKEFFYMMFVEPLSETSSRMRYEIYRNKQVSDDAFKGAVNFFKQVEGEDKWLSNTAQPGLNSDTYIAGPLHPYMEKAVAYFEDVLRKKLADHVEAEKQIGKEIRPAVRDLANTQLNKDEQFCRDLCSSENPLASERGVLAW
jgi:hypothetical protein